MGTSVQFVLGTLYFKLVLGTWSLYLVLGTWHNLYQKNISLTRESVLLFYLYLVHDTWCLVTFLPRNLSLSAKEERERWVLLYNFLFGDAFEQCCVLNPNGTKTTLSIH